MLMVIAFGLPVQAQTTYKKRVLFYGSSLQNSVNGQEVSFVNSHAAEFQPVDNSTPGKSAVWSEQDWINATVADFKQFDVIAISDTVSGGNPPGLIASRAIWGSAVDGNMFIAGGDPLADGYQRIFRQGIRFGAIQAGNAHNQTGLYIALDHMTVGQTLNGTTAPTQIPILSWFGSFTAVNLNNSGTHTSRLISAHPILNVLGSDLSGYNGATVAQGFHSWPAPFFPVAQRLADPNPTPTNTPFYTAPCEADTGYELCSGQSPLVYILARSVNLGQVTRLVSAQCNVALNVGQTCNFSAYSTLVPDPNPNNPSGPSTQVSWNVVSGPNAGQHGKCTRQTIPPYGLPTGIWTASYNNQGGVCDNNFQDKVQLFLDYPQGNNPVNPPDAAFNDMLNSADPNDLNDPAPGFTIEYGTTFTVNWGIPTIAPLVSIANLFPPLAAAEPATEAKFRLSRTGATTLPLTFKVCVSGTATPEDPNNLNAPKDYQLRVGSSTVPVVGGEATLAIPAGSATLDLIVHPLDDNLAEGTETVHVAIEDVPPSTYTYVVSGLGFAQFDILDNDQSLVTAAGYVNVSEQSPQTPGAWIIDTASPITAPLKVYFTFGGTADIDVDYTTALPAAIDDTDPADNILLPSGIGRVTIQPGQGSPAGPGHHAVTFNVNAFQDSRTEGTESATITLLPQSAYKIGASPAGTVNITDDDSPKIPAKGYAITDIGDAFHTVSTAAGINNSLVPQVAGSYTPATDPDYFYHAFQWSAGTYTDIPPIPATTQRYITYGKAINDNGWVVGSGLSVVNSSWISYYYLWNGANTVELFTPAGALLGTGPRAINDVGWTVGEAMNTSFGVNRAARWDTSGQFLDLGGLSPNQFLSTYAWALGSSAIENRVAGESQFDLTPLGVSAITTAFHAFRTQPGINPQSIQYADDLGNVLASETSSSGAYAVNGLSEIAGYCAYSATERRAAYKDGNSGKNKGWRTLGVLSGGSGAGQSAQALGMNDVGLIVGWSRTTTTGNPKAVVWENYQTPAATDLNLRIPVADRANWLLQYATGINSSGKIVGFGLKNGSQRAFLLTPIP